MNILIVANTGIGIPGNVGSRVKPIINELTDNGHIVDVITRKVSPDLRCRTITILPFYHILSRTFNLFGRLTGINLRALDATLFDLLSALVILANYPPVRRSYHLAIIFEYTTLTSSYLRKLSTHVITDSPMVPESVKLSNPALFKLLHLPYRRCIDNIERKAFANSDRIICTSFYHSTFIQELGTNKTIHNIPFSTPSSSSDWDSLSPRTDLLAQGKINYIFVGSITHRKGAGNLCKAWRTFVNLDLIKNNNLKPYLRLLGKVQITLPSESTISTYGFQQPASFFRTSHYFILPSLLEGYPKATAEAISHGSIPLITDASGYSSEIDEFSIRINSHSVDDILHALVQSLQCLHTWHHRAAKCLRYNESLQPYASRYTSLVLNQ